MERILTTESALHVILLMLLVLHQYIVLYAFSANHIYPEIILHGHETKYTLNNKNAEYAALAKDIVHRCAERIQK